MAAALFDLCISIVTRWSWVVLSAFKNVWFRTLAPASDFALLKKETEQAGVLACLFAADGSSRKMALPASFQISRLGFSAGAFLFA